MRSAAIILSTIALAACGMAADAQENAGDGSSTKRSYNVGAFDGVALAGSHDVIVTVGGARSVRAEGDAEVLDQLEVKVENGTLRIGTRKGVRWPSGFWNNRRPVTVYVTAPALSSAAVAGSGDMRIDTIQGDSFKGVVAGSGDLDINSVRVGEAQFSVAGSGDITAAGSANSLQAKIAGSGDIDLAGFETRQAAVSVVGSGDVRTRASETASVSIMGSGNVTVAGTARCTVSKRGSGSVNCGS